MDALLNALGAMITVLGCVIIGLTIIYVVDILVDKPYESQNNSPEDKASASSEVQVAQASPQPPNNNNNRNNNDKQRNGTPKNNQAQNRQIDDISNKVGLTKYQRRMLHDEISGQDFSYQEILEIAYEIKGLFLK